MAIQGAPHPGLALPLLSSTQNEEIKIGYVVPYKAGTMH